METKIISVANHKGGVGKTTTVASVGKYIGITGTPGADDRHGCSG